MRYDIGELHSISIWVQRIDISRNSFIYSKVEIQLEFHVYKDIYVTTGHCNWIHAVCPLTIWTLITCRGTFTQPRKSSWLPDRALWAICLKKRPNPLTPRTSFSLLTASNTDDSSSWSLNKKNHYCANSIQFLCDNMRAPKLYFVYRRVHEAMVHLPLCISTRPWKCIWTVEAKLQEL
jgi:hypothetical protein